MNKDLLVLGKCEKNYDEDFLLKIAKRAHFFGSDGCPMSDDDYRIMIENIKNE